MYQPYGVTTLFKNRTKPQKKIPKTLLTFFFILTFGLGLDLGFTNLLNKTLRSLANILCGSLVVVIIVILLAPLARDRVEDAYWVMISVMQYVLYAIAIRFTSYSLYDFLIEIYSIDETMPRISKERIGVVTLFYAAVLYFSKWVIYYVYCGLYFPEICDQPFVPYYVYGMFSLGVDQPSIVLVLIYYYIYCCVKYLNEMLKDNFVEIEPVKKRYMVIADCYDKIKPLYNKLLCLGLLFEVPKLMGLMWHMLKHIRDMDAGWLGYLGDYVYASHIMSNIFWATLVVQMVKSQVAALQLKLHKILIDEQDMVRHSVASRLVVYMQERQLQHEVGGVVPIDFRLPVSLINICATYMVVVVQFTHLYD